MAITAGELRELLEDCDDDSPIRIISGNRPAMEYTVGTADVVFKASESVLYLIEGGQIGYVSGEAAELVDR